VWTELVRRCVCRALLSGGPGGPAGPFVARVAPLHEGKLTLRTLCTLPVESQVSAISSSLGMLSVEAEKGMDEKYAASLKDAQVCGTVSSAKQLRQSAPLLPLGREMGLPATGFWLPAGHWNVFVWRAWITPFCAQFSGNMESLLFMCVARVNPHQERCTTSTLTLEKRCVAARSSARECEVGAGMTSPSRPRSILKSTCWL
jgi:hypothetical protein